MTLGGSCEVEPVRLGDLTGQLDGVLSRLHELDFSGATGLELAEAMPALIRAGRRLGAVEAKVLDEVNRQRVYAPDGHLSSKVMVRHVGQFGTTMGSITADPYEAFTRAEVEADWEKARAEHGDAATVDDLARTPGQRRADAGWAMRQAAIAHAPEGVNLGPVLNLVMDHDTFEAHSTGTRSDPIANPAGYRTAAARPCRASPSIPTTRSTPPWSAMSGGWCSTPAVWSSTWAARAGCSPEPSVKPGAALRAAPKEFSLR